jgi:hypothetical protein
MTFVRITKTIFSESFLVRSGMDGEASAELFACYLRERWKARLKQAWPGALVSVLVKVEPGDGVDSPMDLWGENAAGDQEDLDWMKPVFEADLLDLVETFHEWAIPTGGPDA